MKYIRTIIFLLVLLALNLISLSKAESESYPIELYVSDYNLDSADIEGSAFIKLGISNISDEDYTLQNPVLDSELIKKPRRLKSGKAEADEIMIEAGQTKEIEITSLVQLDDYSDEPFLLTLTWVDVIDDIEREATAYLSASNEYNRELTLECKAEKQYVQAGAKTYVHITIENDSSSEASDLYLYDEILGEIPLPNDLISRGDSFSFDFEFIMPDEDVELMPFLSYNFNGKQKETRAEECRISPAEALLLVTAKIVEKGESKNLFSVTISNAGSGNMYSVRLYNNQGQSLSDSFSLSKGKSKSIDINANDLIEGTALSFYAKAVDWNGEDYISENTETFILQPDLFEKDKVFIQLNAALSAFEPSTNTATVLFEIRNYSGKEIFNASIKETYSVNREISKFSVLSKGDFSTKKDFNISSLTQQLVFSLEAYDADGNLYVTDPVFIDVSGLIVSYNDDVHNKGQVLITGGSLFDSDKIGLYVSYLILGLLAVGLLFLISSTLYKNGEKTINDNPAIPTDDSIFEDTASRDTAKVRFGYTKPAKLRFGEKTDSTPVPNLRENSEQEESFIKTGTYAKTGKQIKMLTREDTRVFAVPFAERTNNALFQETNHALNFTSDKYNPVMKKPGENPGNQTVEIFDFKKYVSQRKKDDKEILIVQEFRHPE